MFRFLGETETAAAAEPAATAEVSTPMSAELTGDLISRDESARHDALMLQFARGACDVCIALYWIREEETYRSRGFKSWKAFVLGSTGLSEKNAKDYANCGPLLEALIAAGEGDLIRHPDMLKPIAGMLSLRKPETRPGSVRRMLGIVRNAAARARREMVPFDAKMIAECALKAGWDPDWKRKKKGGDEGPKTEEQKRADMRAHIELAFNVILDYRRSGFDLEREIRVTQVPGFDDVREVLNDAKDSEEPTS